MKTNGPDATPIAGVRGDTWSATRRAATERGARHALGGGDARETTRDVGARARASSV